MSQLLIVAMRVSVPPLGDIELLILNSRGVGHAARVVVADVLIVKVLFGSHMVEAVFWVGDDFFWRIGSFFVVLSAGIFLHHRLCRLPAFLQHCLFLTNLPPPFFFMSLPKHLIFLLDFLVHLSLQPFLFRFPFFLLPQSLLSLLFQLRIILLLFVVALLFFFFDIFNEAEGLLGGTLFDDLALISVFLPLLNALEQFAPVVLLNLLAVGESLQNHGNQLYKVDIEGEACFGGQLLVCSGQLVINKEMQTALAISAYHSSSELKNKLLLLKESMPVKRKQFQVSKSVRKIQTPKSFPKLTTQEQALHKPQMQKVPQLNPGELKKTTIEFRSSQAEQRENKNVPLTLQNWYPSTQSSTLLNRKKPISFREASQAFEFQKPISPELEKSLSLYKGRDTQTLLRKNSLFLLSFIRTRQKKNRPTPHIGSYPLVYEQKYQPYKSPTPSPGLSRENEEKKLRKKQPVPAFSQKLNEDERCEEPLYPEPW